MSLKDICQVLIATIILFYAAVNGLDRRSYLFITNPTPYSLILRSVVTTSGEWRVSPQTTISPFRSDAPILGDKWGPYGSEATLTYEAVLGLSSHNPNQKSMGTFQLHFLDAMTGSNKVQWTFTPNNQILRDRDGNLLGSITSFYIKTMTGDGACSGSWRYNDIDPNNSPICISTGIEQELQITASTYLSKLDPIFGKILRENGNNIYSSPSEFANAVIVDNFDSDYNSIAWSINDSHQWYVQPLLDYDSANDFYLAFGYTPQIDCVMAVDLVLYCIQDSSGACQPYTHDGVVYHYTHAANGNFPLHEKNWFSKFGMGPLISHDTITSISKPGGLYGSPALCFKRRGIPFTIPLLTTDDLSFSEEHFTAINNVISGVAAEFRAKFEATYEDWQNFCLQPEIAFSSISHARAQGEAFKQLVQMGKENPKEFMPLLVEKLMDPRHFMAYVIFEAVTGKRDERRLTSSQRVAFEQANNWLQENNIIKTSPLLIDSEPFFSEQNFTAIRKLTSGVSEKFRTEFETTYEDWQNFCLQPKIALSALSHTRAQGKAFEQLLRMGEENPKELMPLLVEKLMDSRQFMAYVIFEAITGKHDNRGMISSQRVAFDHANNWIREQGLELYQDISEQQDL